jgi:DNA-binding NarL/FixJ family response regulator
VTVRAVLADDDLLVRAGVQRLLEAEAARVELVGVCDDRPSLLDAVERERPDVVLAEARLPEPGGDRAEVATTLRRLHPEIGIVLLSRHVDAGHALALLEGGSAGRGYLLKERLAGGRQLADALTDVAAGGSVIDPRVVEELVNERSRAERSPLRQLTPRELEILREVATGRSNAAIARDLVVTKRAVERHINSIFAKLRLPDESEASRRVAATLVFLAHGEPGPSGRESIG